MVKEFALASGHNNAAGLQNIENLFISNGTLIRYQPRAEIITRGVERITVDQHSHFNGTKEVRWSFSILPFSLLSLLVTTFIGSWDTDSANVTLRTLGQQHTFTNYNAVMVTPDPAVDYSRRREFVVGVQLTYRIIAAL